MPQGDDYLQGDRHNLEALLMQYRWQAAHELTHINDQPSRDRPAAEAPTCNTMHPLLH